jgi:methylmalonyl-CoA mutase cobalamin-binding domain/chain
MTDLYVPAHPVRFVSAASLFDGHDAAINIMRRILQRQGAEVVHLGHNRSVDEVVAAAIQEDAQGVAISSYQGGHVEYFSYLVDLLRERGAGHIRVYGGGGGVIVPREIALLHERGVARIFSPEDGQRLGLPGMINLMIRECDVDLAAQPPTTFDGLFAGETTTLARALTLAEDGRLPADLDLTPRRTVPVLGITGTGGSGKSSLTDELVRRFRLDQEDKLRIAVLAVDPTRRKGGGALLGDRIRMNSLTGENVFFRSMATRGAAAGLPERLADVIAVLKVAGFDLVIVETPGIGQGDATIVPFVDRSLYVMTPEFGAASQLEKIDMLDFTDVVAINKFERRGGEDARRDVGRQLVRQLLVGEVVHVHLDRRLRGLVLAAPVLELAYQLLFLGVHADHRRPDGEVLDDLVVEVAELGVPVDVLAALGDLGVGLQAEPQPAKHPRHRPVRHPMPAGGQRLGQVAGRLGRPHQRRLRIPPRLRVHQPSTPARAPDHFRWRLAAPARRPHPARGLGAALQLPHPLGDRVGMYPGRRGHHRDPATAQLGRLGGQHQPPLPLVQMRTQHRVLARHRLRDLRVAPHSTDGRSLGAENLHHFIARPNSRCASCRRAVRCRRCRSRERSAAEPPRPWPPRRHPRSGARCGRPSRKVEPGRADG